MRYYYVLKLANTDDIWFFFADSLNWCSIEVYAAIICGSASTFRVLFKTHAPHLWGGSRYGLSGASNGGAKGSVHPYDQSRSGIFALKTFGQGNDRADKSKISAMDSNSEEAIVLQAQATPTGRISTFEGKDGGGIMRNTVFTVDVSAASLNGDSQKERVVPSILRA